MFEHKISEKHKLLKFINDNIESLNKEVIIQYTLFKERKDILEYDESLKEYDKINKELEEIKKKREEFYYSIQKSLEDIKEQIQILDKSIKITENEKDLEIILEFPRDIKTYSTGEINYITFIFKLYEFIGSEKKICLADDILTSYDKINQYKIINQILEASNDDKRILIFTHNIDLFRIMNLQDSESYKGYFLENIKHKIVSFEFDFPGYINKINEKDFKEGYINQFLTREEENKEINKLFHYDEFYEVDGYNNEYFVEKIETFDNIPTFENFYEYMEEKIMLFLSLRVWIEKQIYLKLSEEQKEAMFKKKNPTLGYKIYYCDKNNIFNENIIRKLKNKKVLLNDDYHVNNQKVTFDYIYNIKLSDLISEIYNIKSLFKDINTN